MTEMRIPKKIRVGKVTWRVREEDHLTDEKDNPVCGLCDYGKREIVISGELTKREKYITFIHEILHCVAKKGTGLSRHQEERFIGAVDEKLYDVLVKNRLFATQRSTTRANRARKRTKR